jgi:hypothetical protein
MTLLTLIGAILGSGAFIAFGRRPAEKLITVVQQRIDQNRRR